MDAARPLGSGDNFLRTKLQLPVLNATYDGLPRSYVVDHIHSTSDLLKKGDTISKVWAHVYAFAVPVFLAASIIKLSIITACDTGTSLLGYSRKEFVVINQGKPEEVKELKEVSIYKDVKELALHIAAIVTTFICYIPGIFAPGIYYRENLKPLPESSEQKRHATELEKAAEPFRSIQLENDRLREENKTAKLDAFFAMFPKITAQNLQEAIELLSVPELDGINLSQVTEESLGRAYSQETWGTEDGRVFDPGSPRGESSLERTGTAYTPVGIRDKGQFLKPIGTIELSIDCRKVASKYLQLILSKPHEIHRLVLINPDMEVLTAIENRREQRGVLSNLHSLVIREHERLNCEELYLIAERFTNIACFDVRECRLNQELTREFTQHHIVCGTRYRSERLDRESRQEPARVAVETKEDFDNIDEQFKHLNEEVLFKTMMKGFTRESANIMYFANFFPVVDEDKFFHPAAPFVTKLCCFKGSEIGSSHLKSLMPRLARSFPHLRVLDFGGCKLLDSDALSHIEKFPVLNLYLDGCEGIFYKQIKAEQAGSYNRTSDYVSQNRRHYVLDVAYATNRFLYLFNHGTKVILLRRMECILEKNSLLRSRDTPSYYQIIKPYLERHLFPEMVHMAQPPRYHGTYIGVNVGSEESNFQQDSRV